MKKISITTKIMLWYTMFLIVVAVILMVVLYRYYDFREQITAEQQIIRPVADVSDRSSTYGRDYAKSGDINYYTEDTYISVYQADGAFFAGLLPDGIGDLPELDLDNTQTFDDSSGRQWYIRDTIIYLSGQDNMYIRGIMENTGYESAYRRMGRFLMFMIPGLIILAIAGGWFISWRVLRPIRDLINVTNEIREDGNLSRRVPVPNSEDETSELTESINGMFDTIEKMVARERQFASDVSHELRTPLTIIHTQSEYALEDSSHAKRALETINRESHRMSRMITNLLMITRSDSGRLHPEMKPIDISELLADLTDQAKLAAAEREADIEYINETGKNRFVIESDEDLLMRIVLNLLENAARYGKNPKGHIEVRLRSEGDNVVITVADDGEGIAPEDQSKVWNRFYRTESSRSMRDSTGLGLAMVDSLTRALGGSIRIVPDSEKKPGELPGAVFEITLPQKNKPIHEN